WGTISSGAAPSVSWHPHLRVVHCWRLASPGRETGSPVQHPVAETAEAGGGSTGFDRPVWAPSGAEDQAADPAAISSGRGETGARIARERGDRQDRSRVQRIIA